MKLLKKTSFVFYCFCLGVGWGEGWYSRSSRGRFIFGAAFNAQASRLGVWFLFDMLHAMGSPPTFDLKEDKPFLTIQNQDSETTICQAVVCCCVKATLMTYIVWHHTLFCIWDGVTTLSNVPAVLHHHPRKRFWRDLKRKAFAFFTFIFG